MTDEATENPQRRQPVAVLSSDGLDARSSFAPTVVMPGGRTVTPEGWMWVLGFAMAGCKWAIEAAGRDAEAIAEAILGMRSAQAIARSNVGAKLETTAPAQD